MLKRFALLLLLVAVYLPFHTAASQAPQHEPGDSRVDARGVEQVWVPAGCFKMGTSDEQLVQVQAQKPPSWVGRAMRSEQPQHEVCLTAGYWIDRTEVTNAAWQVFVDGGYDHQDYWSEAGWAWRSKLPADFLPVTCSGNSADTAPKACITWYEAEAYAAWRGGSLPTEAQWEYAARGPESRVYPWGDEWDAALANVVDSTETTPVGSTPGGASWIGAQDMAGNVMEWAQDWLDARYYGLGVRDDPTGPEKGRIKVERGGWFGSNPFVARSAYRHFEDPPTYQDFHIGARIVSPGDVEG